MENKNAPAFPQSVSANETGIYLATSANIRDNEEVIGVTKREYFAAKAMQGLLASPSTSIDEMMVAVPYDAVRLADALLAELSKS